MAARIAFGDVFEIATGKGLAYLIYTHKHTEPPRYGALIRVLKGLYKSRPKDIDAIVEAGEQFAIFFPLGAALNRGIVKKVGNVPVPSSMAKFPIFKGNNDPKAKADNPNWWLWDGNKEWKVGRLTSAEELSYPINSVVNDTALIEYIEDDWSPEKGLGPPAPMDVEKAALKFVKGLFK
jgi:hypothetical protein